MGAGHAAGVDPGTADITPIRADAAGIVEEDFVNSMFTTKECVLARKISKSQIKSPN
jgi:hypothetical protein